MLALFVLLASQPQPLLRLEPGALHRLVLLLPDETIVLERRGTQWLLPEWGYYPAEQVFAESLVRMLEKLPVGTPVNEPARVLGLDPPQRRLLLFGEGGSELGELWVGKPAESYGACYVSLPRGTRLERLDIPLLPALMRPTWGSRTVWRINRSTMRAIRTAGFPRDLEVRFDDGVPHLISPASGTLGDGFEDLVEALTHLRAGNVEKSADLTFPVVATITVVTPHVDLVLELGPLTDGKRLARTSHPGVVYHFSDRPRQLVAGALAAP